MRVLKSSSLSLSSLAKVSHCVPFGSFGFDPVPRGHPGRDLRSGVALELDGVEARGLRGINEGLTPVEPAVVVHTGFGDDVRGLADADPSSRRC